MSVLQFSLNDALGRWFRRRAQPSRFYHGSGSGSFTLAVNEHLLTLHVSAHASDDVEVAIGGSTELIVRAGTTLTWTVAGYVSGAVVAITGSATARWFAEYVASDG